MLLDETKKTENTQSRRSDNPCSVKRITKIQVGYRLMEIAAWMAVVVLVVQAALSIQQLDKEISALKSIIRKKDDERNTLQHKLDMSKLITEILNQAQENRKLRGQLREVEENLKSFQELLTNASWFSTDTITKLKETLCKLLSMVGIWRCDG